MSKDGTEWEKKEEKNLSMKEEDGGLLVLPVHKVFASAYIMRMHLLYKL